MDGACVVVGGKLGQLVGGGQDGHSRGVGEGHTGGEGQSGGVGVGQVSYTTVEV